MNMLFSFIKKYLLSSLGIVLVLAIAILANIIIHKSVRLRLDLTEDSLYTLSDGTKKILSKLDTPVTLRFYCSRKDNQMPVTLRGFANRVEEILGEYVQAGKGKVKLEKFDPVPDSDSEDSANMDGISGEMLPNGQKFYLGLAVNCLDKTVSIPTINPMKENTLEYDLSRAIYEASQAKMPALGILSALPIMGGNMTPFMRNQAPKPPWILVQELKRNFDVRAIDKDCDKIPDDIKVLMVLHPQDLPKKTLYAIDQYLMSGGKLVVAVDPLCVTEQRNSMQAMMGQQTMPGSSSLPDLFSAWGVDFAKDKVTVDIDHAARNFNNPDADSYPAVLDFSNIENKSGDTALSGISHLNMIYCGAFKLDLKEGIEKSILLASSDKSQMINAFLAQGDSASIMKDFTSDDKAKDLIVKLSGKFKSAFPDGKPAEEKKDGENAKEEKKPSAEPDPAHLKESVKNSFVALLSDVDMLADEFCVAKQKFLGQTIIQPYNDNLNMLQNICEQLSGDSDLISIRTKKVKERPFKKLEEMQNEAQQKYQKKILEMEEEKEAAQRKLNELQKSKSSSQKFILSPEQKEEVEKFKKKIAEMNRQLKDMRKEFRKDIESTMLRYEIANIALFPAIVVLVGLLVFAREKMKSRRK